MLKFKVVIDEYSFGIIDEKEVKVVPCMHMTKEDAIEEFVYFETQNTNAPKHRKFLENSLTLEEIEEIKEALLNS